MQYSENMEADYAVITIKEPFVQPFERIPNAYKLIMEYLQVNNFKEKQQDNIITCFEYEYMKQCHLDNARKIRCFFIEMKLTGKNGCIDKGNNDTIDLILFEQDYDCMTKKQVYICFIKRYSRCR